MELLLSGFRPITAGLYGIDQRFLISVHCAGFCHLDFQIAAVEAEKSFRLKQIVETAHSYHLKDNTVLMPVVARGLIHVDRAASGAFSFLYGNPLRRT